MEELKNKNIPEQIAAWNEEEEYQKIVDVLLAVPEEERTPELVSELARAYNNLAGEENGDESMYRTAIELLKSVEEELKEDHCWNYRMAYAYCFLDEPWDALPYFEKALEARPGDEDTEEMIDFCLGSLALPRFEKPFCQRVREGWESFLAGEEDLRRGIDEKRQGDEIVEQCNKLLKPAFSDVSFELGYNGRKHELILSPEGDKAKLFQLVYFQKQAPKEVLEHWNILVGRQHSGSFGLQIFGQNVSAEDIFVWVKQQGDDELELSLYCEKLLSFLKEDENKAYWMMYIMLDNVIGEIAAMRYIGGVELLEKPLEGVNFSLEKLLEYLNQRFSEQDGDIMDAEKYCERYTVYETEPSEEEDADVRMDIYVGGTNCPTLINQYWNNAADTMNAYHKDGIAAGFFYYPLTGFTGEDRSGKILDFRDAVSEEILAGAGADAVTFIGGASGIYFGYIDFIAWDLKAVLDTAVEVLKEKDIAWAVFHSFRRDVNGIILKSDQNGD